MFNIEEIYSVSDYIKLCKNAIEKNIPQCFVEGEISNLSMPSSGHWYFSLKDKNSQVRCAFFRLNQRKIKFTPENGMSVIIRGATTLYPQRGDFQLIIQQMEPAGIGNLQLAFDQLKNKLKKAAFRFGTEVQEINNHKIKLQSGEIIEHEGVIIATQASRILHGLRNQNTDWKSCHCLYFEVDQTNIPENTIALNTQSESLVNNYYAYQDKQNGKTILSATAVKDRAMDIASIIAEIQEQTGAKQVHLLHHYEIKQALLDITNLQMTVDPSESQIQENIFLAGDYLLNGSLNAAMESGRLAAQGLMEKKKSLWDNLENRKN